MLYRACSPASPLSDFIEDVRLYDDYKPTHLKERILPSGTIELVINLRDDELRIYDRVGTGVCERFSGAIVSGTYNRFFVIDTAEEASLLGVHFRPGGAFPFFDLPISELVDTHVDLETLWGRSARELRDRLRAVTTPLAKFRVIEMALLARLTDEVKHHGAVRFALDTFGRSTPTTLRALCEQSPSEPASVHRGLQDRGRSHTETVPSCAAVSSGSQAGTARHVAGLESTGPGVDSTYQSHLIRDFVGFSGFSPAAFSRH
jgi:hypothetical protein